MFGSIPAAGCTVGTCGGSNKCDSVDVLTVTVNEGDTEVAVQTHDGLFGSLNEVVTSVCYGTETPGARKGCTPGGGAGTGNDNTGVCNNVVSIKTEDCCVDGMCLGDPHFKTWNDEWYGTSLY